MHTNIEAIFQGKNQLLIFLNHANGEHLLNGFWYKLHNKKKYRMLGFLLVGSVGSYIKDKKKRQNKNKKTARGGLISGYSLFVPVYSRLFHLIINFFPPKSMDYLKFQL